MTRLIISFLFLALSFFQLNSQIVVSFDSAEAAPGNQVTIDVSVDDFDNIVLFQFGILWDPQVASFNSITNITDELPEFTEDGNIGTPSNAPMELNDGEIFTLWSLASTEPFSLTDGTVLFSIVLDIVGDECETTIGAGDLPPDRLIEVYDETFNENIGVTSIDGDITVDSDDCGGGGGDDDVVVKVESACFTPGESDCISISVLNFIEIETAQFGIVWDETVLEYTGVQNFGLPGLTESLFNQSNVDSGELKFLWFDNTGANPVTLDGCAEIFQICFDAIGSSGTNTDIEIVDLPAPPPLFIEFSSMGTTLPFTVENGNVMISDCSDPLIITGAEVEGCGNVCVPFTVTGFDNVGSIQYTMVWDTAFMCYTGQENLNTDLPIADFNFNAISSMPGEKADKVRFSWNTASACEVEDGSVLYEICFDVSEDAVQGDMTNIDIVNDSQVQIEFGDCDGNAIPTASVTLNSGKVTAGDCDPLMCPVTVNNPCFGENGGASTTISGGVPPYSTIIWTNESGTQVGSQDVIFNQPPGAYELFVEDSAGNSCSVDFNIVENPEIVIMVTTTNAGCGMNGSVEIEVSGGTGDLTVMMDPDGDVNDLPVGMYTINVEDAVGCRAQATFEIEDDGNNVPIDISVSTVQPCEGEDGMADISYSGGCGELTCSVSGGFSCDDTVFPPGTYTVSVSDGVQPAAMVDFTIEEIVINPIVFTGGPSGGDDGFINVEVDEGCDEFSWTGPNGFTSNQQNLTGLAPGVYNLTVTCEEGCEVTGSYTVTIIGECAGFGEISSTDVVCFGDSNGTIDATLGEGCENATISVNGGPGMGSPLSMDMLEPGEYVLEAIDNGVSIGSQTIVISEPEQLTATVDTLCTDPVLGLGNIAITVSGGTPPYDVSWNQPGLEGLNPTNVPSGTYTAIITDANGCDIFETAVVCEMIDPTIPCFTSINIITPNSDGMNDELFINCAQQTDNSIEIYDRWGRLVHSGTDYRNDWQGVDLDGDILPEGAYMWVLRVEVGLGDTRIYKGTVTVLNNI